jgi:hypothetical protein
VTDSVRNVPATSTPSPIAASDVSEPPACGNTGTLGPLRDGTVVAHGSLGIGDGFCGSGGAGGTGGVHHVSVLRSATR